jgi:L-alanine-DL-glutamate epimerase-like enolase superfamily enzyme
VIRAPLVRSDVWLTPLELPHVLKLGTLEYRTRDYVVLRLTDSAGNTGTAAGYTRYTPLIETIQFLLQQMDPRDPAPQAVSDAFRRQFIPGWAAMVRGASLIDLALWDLRSRQEAVAIDSLLFDKPSGRPSIPAMAVAGYFSDVRGTGAILEEIDRFVDEGYSIIKLEIPGIEAAADVKLLESIASRLPSSVRLAADFHGMFSAVADFEAYRSAFTDLDLMFHEDPFSPFDVGLYRSDKLGRTTPIAAGEDMPTTNAYDDVLESGVEYIRLDSTTVGGLSELPVWLTSLRPETKILPHVWPWIHEVLDSASHAVHAIEVIPHYVGAEPLWSLLEEQTAPVENGSWKRANTPGLGWNFNFDAVQRSSTRHETLEFDTSGRVSEETSNVSDV